MSIIIVPHRIKKTPRALNNRKIKPMTESHWLRTGVSQTVIYRIIIDKVRILYSGVTAKN